MFYQLHKGYWYRCDIVSIRPLVVQIRKTGERVLVANLDNLSRTYPG